MTVTRNENFRTIYTTGSGKLKTDPPVTGVEHITEERVLYHEAIFVTNNTGGTVNNITNITIVTGSTTNNINNITIVSGGSVAIFNYYVDGAATVTVDPWTYLASETKQALTKIDDTTFQGPSMYIYILPDTIDISGVTMNKVNIVSTLQTPPIQIITYTGINGFILYPETPGYSDGPNCIKTRISDEINYYNPINSEFVLNYENTAQLALYEVFYVLGTEPAPVTTTTTTTIASYISVGDQLFGGLVGHIFSPEDPWLNWAILDVNNPIYADITNPQKITGWVVGEADIDDRSQIWGLSGSTLSSAQEFIGDGYTATQAILAAYPDENTYAKLCVNYSGGSFTDWVLPSHAETQSFYVLNSLNLGNFVAKELNDDNYFYATASDVLGSEVTAWAALAFWETAWTDQTGLPEWYRWTGSDTKGINTYHIRPIRYFSTDRNVG